MHKMNHNDGFEKVTLVKSVIFWVQLKISGCMFLESEFASRMFSEHPGIRPNIPSDWYSWWKKSLDHLRYINYIHVEAYQKKERFSKSTAAWFLPSKVSQHLPTSGYLPIWTPKIYQSQVFWSFPNGQKTAIFWQFSDSSAPLPGFQWQMKVYSRDPRGEKIFHNPAGDETIASWATGQPNL